MFKLQPNKNMPNEMNISDALQAFQKLTEQHAQGCYNAWATQYRQSLETLRTKLNGCNGNLQKAAASGQTPAAFWKILTAFTEEVDDWVSDISLITPETQPADVSRQFSDELENFLADYPDEIRIPITDADLAPNQESSGKIRFWQFRQRSRLSLQKFGKLPANLFRRLTGKDPLPMRYPERQFSSSLFFRNFAEVSFEDFLIAEWQQFLNIAIHQYETLSDRYRQINNRFLFLNDEISEWAKSGQDALNSSLTEIPECVALIDDFISTVDKQILKSTESYNSWFAKTAQALTHQWQYAGTQLIPVHQFSETALTHSKHTQEKKFLPNRNEWVKSFQGETREWRHQLAIRRIQFTASCAYLDALKAIEEKITAQLIPPFQKASAMFSASLEKFNTELEGDSEDLRKSIILENRSILKSIRNELLPAMIDPLTRSPQEGIIKLFLHQIDEAVKALPEKYLLFEIKNSDVIPPECKHTDIPVKELLEKEFWLSLREKIDAFLENVGKENKLMLRRISEVDEIVEFNLEAALKNLRQENSNVGEARKVMTDGLSRASSRMDLFVEGFAESQQQIDDRLFELAGVFVRELNGLLENQNLLELNFKLTRAKARERFLHYRRMAWTFITSSIPIVWQYLKKLWEKVRESYLRLRKATGLSDTSSSDDEAYLFHFLQESHQRISTLPYIYQQLFKMEPLEDERFFSGRETHLKNLKADFAHWQQGHYITTAIVGESGSGRTTVVNFARQEIYKHSTIVRIDLQSTVRSPALFAPLLAEAFSLDADATINDVERALSELEKPVVCLVENLQNLFLRTVNGFDLLEEFLAMITRTHVKVYWVFSCTWYSWAFLDKVINISRYFQRVINLSGLSSNAIEKIIMKRHRLTGYELEYEVPPGIAKSRRFRKLSGRTEQQQFLHEMLFEQLNKLATGNISVAMLFWLLGIKRFEENKMYVDPDISLDFSFINRLPAEELFTLGGIIQHEVLVAEEHAQVFNMAFQDSTTLLERLHNRGILQSTEDGFRVHPFLFRPVVQALKVKNILH